MKSTLGTSSAALAKRPDSDLIAMGPHIFVVALGMTAFSTKTRGAMPLIGAGVAVGLSLFCALNVTVELVGCSVVLASGSSGGAFV